MYKYAVYWEGEYQIDFDTLKEAQAYVRRDIKGIAETYNKTQKWVKEHFTWEIEKVYYIDAPTVKPSEFFKGV